MAGDDVEGFPGPFIPVSLQTIDLRIPGNWREVDAGRRGDGCRTVREWVADDGRHLEVWWYTDHPDAEGAAVNLHAPDGGGLIHSHDVDSVEELKGVVSAIVYMSNHETTNRQSGNDDGAASLDDDRVGHIYDVLAWAVEERQNGRAGPSLDGLKADLNALEEAVPRHVPDPVF